MLKIAKYFNSLQFVVICIICIQITLIIDTATLLYSSFPATMWDASKLIASIVGAVTIECFLLVISVNMHLFTKNTKLVPLFMGLASSVMTLFFLDTFSSTDLQTTSKRLFVATLFGFVNYMLGELFTKKWNEYINGELQSHTTEQELKQAQYKLTQVEYELTYAHDKIQATEVKLIELQNQNNNVVKEFGLKHNEVISLERKLTEVEQELELMKNKLTRKKVNT